MFYLVARDQSNETWRIIKIERSKPTELIIANDPHPYTATECLEILQRIRQDNKETRGLKLVTYCYGIIGFVKFHGPYYMLMITKRRKIGTILTHDVYSVKKSAIIPIPHELPQMANPEDEKRDLDYFCSVDLSNGFFFSYSYNLAQTLQQNMPKEDELESMTTNTTFIWNQFLTESVLEQFRNPIWTVSLVHGFFEQIKVSGSVKNFRLTIIARRSRHFSGPRFLKRGINEEGKAANDVEIEQIVFEETEDGMPPEVTSVVQRRGSIPLLWSQEMLKCPISSKLDESYNTTWLHFENLKTTYGDPIIVLNLIKRFEKNPCESLLGFEFEQAIQHINTERLSTNNRILFVHMDVKNYSRRHEALPLLLSIGLEALNQTRMLHCQITPVSDSEDNARTTKMVPVSVQKGVLRTNCLDCLDRTNIGQFAYGLVCLSHQLRALTKSEIAINDDLSHILMDLYEHMGDALSMQYTGSAALNKMFWKERGQCRFISQVQECFRSTQRLFNNKFTDRGKQNAHDMFLGLDSANICGNKETLDKEKCERSLSKSCCGISWKAANYYTADTKLYPVMIELEEAMHRSLTMKQVHPILQYDERFSSGNSSRKQGTLVAEAHKHSSRPGCEELFCSNFLVLDEGSNAVKFLEESVSEG